MRLPTPFGIARFAWRLIPEGIADALRARPSVQRVKTRVIQVLRPTASHDDVYDAEYFEHVDGLAVQSADVMASTIVERLAPNTVLDVGCGTGALLLALRRRGVSVHGLEYSEAALKYCRERQLDVRKLDLERETVEYAPVDTIISTEVAEHLPARMADRFVELLCRSAKTIVFTAAVPGQGGHDHVNEQPHEYWIERFHHRGYELDLAESLKWREFWTQRGVAWFYCQNLMLFRRKA